MRERHPARGRWKVKRDILSVTQRPTSFPVKRNEEHEAEDNEPENVTQDEHKKEEEASDLNEW